MKPVSMINLVKKFTSRYGIVITWKEARQEYNSRGIPVRGEPDTDKSARVLFLKEKYSPLSDIAGVVGLQHDHSRYLLTLPDVEIKKDVIITDNHGGKWKIGTIDWFDVAGTPVAKQAELIEMGDT